MKSLYDYTFELLTFVFMAVYHHVIKTQLGRNVFHSALASEVLRFYSFA